MNLLDLAEVGTCVFCRVATDTAYMSIPLMVSYGIDINNTK